MNTAAGLRDQVTEALIAKSWADWPDPEDGATVIEIQASDATDAVLAVIEQRVSQCWPDPFGKWSAEQADAAKAMKEDILRVLGKARN